MDKVYHFSAPGRTEIGGNHTDHQHGRVIAAAVDMTTTAEVTLNGTNVIRVDSEGYRPVEIDLGDLNAKESERNTTAALIRGVAASFARHGYKLAGFDAKVKSTVLPGSGLSSSAAFEVLIGRILNGLFADNAVSAIEIAQIGQYAENVYYGKPSGLMDQMASSVGGLVFIDFSDPKMPVVEKVDYDFAHSGYTLCTIDAGADHVDLTDEYAAIPAEMKQVAKFFGKEVLREVDEKEFYKEIAELRKETGDRAVLRAIHYFEENARTLAQRDALQAGQFDAFAALVLESGRASFALCQNVYCSTDVRHQGLSVALALSQSILQGSTGAWRMQGGGFAGTIQAYVPQSLLERYHSEIERVFGKGSCYILRLREQGAVKAI